MSFFIRKSAHSAKHRKQRLPFSFLAEIRPDLDRFHLVMDVIERVPKLQSIGAHVLQAMRDKLINHRQYIVTHGDDMPEIRDWKWPY